MTANFSVKDPLHGLAALRRHASTKAKPLGYKPAANAPKQNPTAPPTGFAAIGSYKTIARRYELSHCHPSLLMPNRVTALMVGIPFVVVTSYILYQRGVSSRRGWCLISANSASGSWTRTEASDDCNDSNRRPSYC